MRLPLGPGRVRFASTNAHATDFAHFLSLVVSAEPLPEVIDISLDGPGRRHDVIRGLDLPLLTELLTLLAQLGVPGIILLVLLLQLGRKAQLHPGLPQVLGLLDGELVGLETQCFQICPQIPLENLTVLLVLLVRLEGRPECVRMVLLAGLHRAKDALGGGLEQVVGAESHQSVFAHFLTLPLIPSPFPIAIHPHQRIKQRTSGIHDCKNRLNPLP
mmetsp:Transcript_19777/g.45429  ORF Transcript_19777/g.45429 Transcript_19777/m.45429 type:complete len:216 (-) Transcript_19777:8-655(-)